MKCYKQFRFHKLPISNLWEVQLDYDIWMRLKHVSYQRNCSFSWISRYCVFRLARKKHLKIVPAMEILSNSIKNKYKNSPKLHRHIICLYGEDEKLLRIAAMELKMTISHLIRICLYAYLPKLEKNTFNKRFIYYYGLRITRFIHLTRKNMASLPYYDTFFYGKWPIESWWKRPIPIIPIPSTPENKISPLYGIISDPNSHPGVVKWLLTR